MYKYPQVLTAILLLFTASYSFSQENSDVKPATASESRGPTFFATQKFWAADWQTTLLDAQVTLPGPQVKTLPRSNVSDISRFFPSLRSASVTKASSHQPVFTARRVSRSATKRQARFSAMNTIYRSDTRSYPIWLHLSPINQVHSTKEQRKTRLPFWRGITIPDLELVADSLA